MRDLGVEPDHVRMVERVDERQHVADGRAGRCRRAARWAWARARTRSSYFCDRTYSQRKLMRVAEPLDGFLRILAGVRLDALPPAPEDVRLGAELHAEVDRAHRLLQRVVAHARVVARERAVAKDRIAEQVRRRHRDFHPRFVERRLELADDAIALGGAGVARHEVVVVEVDAVGAELRRARARCASARPAAARRRRTDRGRGCRRSTGRR